MYDLYKIKDIKNLLQKYNFKFSKGLGQNFISNRYLCPKIVSKCDISAQTGIIEIGPGVGILTCELAEKAKKVVSVEIDKNLLPILRETTSQYNNIKFINEDILKINLKELISSEFDEFLDLKVCSNLPYYITSQVIIKLLESETRISSLILMVQKEAAERICALPGSRECGSISLFVQYYADAEILFNVSKGNFIPIPKVDSSVIKITKNPQKSLNIKDKNIFFRVVKSTFLHRRKVILNSLNKEFNIDKDEISKILSFCGISKFSRPEQLSFDSFVNLSNSIYDRII